MHICVVERTAVVKLWQTERHPALAGAEGGGAHHQVEDKMNICTQSGQGAQTPTGRETKEVEIRNRSNEDT